MSNKLPEDEARRRKKVRRIRWQKANPDKVAQAYERWKVQYAKKYPEYFVRFMKRWKSVHPKRYMVNKARQRAKTLGRPFSLTEADIHIPQVCPVLGIPLFWGDEQKSDNSPSLDCLIPALGYVRGNVFVISMRANRLKGDGSWQELEKITNWVREKVNHAAR